MIRILTFAGFLLIGFAVSDCQAQQRRGLFLRGFTVQPQAPLHASPIQTNLGQQQQAQMYQAVPHQNLAHGFQSFPVQQPQLSNYRNPFVSRLLDGPTTPGRRNHFEVESRYIGGFHQNHFNNIGIPSGDVGLRGNALNWRTW